MEQAIFQNNKRVLTSKYVLPLWYYRITRMEYWPTWILFLPQFFIFFWYAITRFKITFFTATNPGIYLSGLYGESKKAILDLIPREYVPRTLFIPNGNDLKNTLLQFSENNFTFPVICKPDAGGRGVGVAKIHNLQELKNYLQNHSGDLLIQSFIDLPNEAGIFFYALPSGKEFAITSITLKNFLEITGDGIHSIEELLHSNLQGLMQLKRLKTKLGAKITTVPHFGKKVMLEPIGNHCRGTEFVDGRKWINAAMTEKLKTIVGKINGVYYGRFDVKYNHIEDLQNCRFMVMELNGLTSEPTHIYDSSYHIFRAWKDIAWHTSKMMKISAENIKRGIKPASFKEVWKCIKTQFF